MEIFQQVAQRSIFGLDVAEVHLRVEVDGAKHIAQLGAVALFNVGQRNVDLLADFIVGAMFVEIIKGGIGIHGEALAAHGPFHAALVAVVLFQIVRSPLLGDVAQVFYE